MDCHAVVFHLAGEDFEEPETSDIVIENGFQGHAEHQRSVIIIDDLLIEPTEEFALRLLFDSSVVRSSNPYAYFDIKDDDSRKFMAMSTGHNLSICMYIPLRYIRHACIDVAYRQVPGQAS